MKADDLKILAGIISPSGSIEAVLFHSIDLGKKRFKRLIRSHIRFRIFKDQQKIVFETTSKTTTTDQRDVMFRYLNEYKDYEALAVIAHEFKEADPFRGESHKIVKAFIKSKVKL